MELSVGCRCSRAKIQQILLGMDLADRAEMIVDGEASVHCQFCNKVEAFSLQDLALNAS
jgi:redox-regulated HSP33 family molecular chaperone